MNLSPEPLPRTYTPDAVNAMLPQATERVKQLQQLQRSIAQTAEELHAASQKIASGNGYPIESLRQQVKTLALHQLQ
ncbi:MAG: DUF2203 family protein, partial [Candidatus Omnitrophica bacterium]|nr:DUF2203 family protein [Candidatus Omnitrophota bacterium]